MAEPRIGVAYVVKMAERAQEQTRETVRETARKAKNGTGRWLRHLAADPDSFRRATAFVLLAVLLTSGVAAAATMRGGPVAAIGGTPVAGAAGTAAIAAPDQAGAPDQPGAPGHEATAGELSGLPAVGPNASVKMTPDELYLLARLINGEARGEPYIGQVAVGAVVLNRVRAGGEFPNTVTGVIYQPGQFEPVHNGQINLTPTDSCLKAAKAAASGQDPTSGALYFWEPDKTWSDYLWSRPFKITIGGHRFTG